MTPRFLIVLGLLCQLSMAQSGQTIRDGTLTDHSYRIRVKAPKGWTILPEAQARALSVDAVSAATGPYGSLCVILVEPVSTGNAGSWAQTVIEGTDVEEKVNELREEFKIHGVTAVRNIMSGRIKDLRIRWQHTFFVRKGYLYQVVCWNRKARVRKDGVTFKGLIDGVSFLEGKIRHRIWKAKTPDVSGSGWRVKDEVFESLPYALRVKPRGRWRVATGESLQQMSDDAEVGLIHDQSFLVIVCERIYGVDKKELIKSHQADFIAGGTLQEGSLKTTVLGEKVEFVKVTVGESPQICFANAYLFVGDTFVQIQSWHQAGYEKQGEKFLKQILPGITSLSEEESKQLERELAAAAPAPREKGPGYFLKNGVYRNYLLGVGWNSPKGLWRVKAGQKARTVNADCCLFIEHPASGIMALVVVEQLEKAMLPNAFHKSRVANIEAEPVVVQQTTIDGRSTLLSSLTLQEINPTTYLIHTLISGKRHYQIAIWGLPGNVEANPEIVSEFKKAFKIL